MADITKIKLNTTSYNLRDANALKLLKDLEANADSISIGFDAGAWKFRMNFHDGTKAEIALGTNTISFNTFDGTSWTNLWNK